MSRLGISVYPDKSTKEKDYEYIKKASNYGFSRIFTCLLSVENKSKNEIKTEYKELISYAHKHNMEVIIDVAPYVFEKLGITYENLSFFKEIGADGFRLDEGFDGLKEALMTYNEYDLKIEINSSFGNGYLKNIISHKPKHKNLITCFNFYPQKYTGLSFEHFERCAKDVSEYGLNSAVFVSSNEKNTFGPWEVSEGLCTLEEHRNLPIDVQARHFYATDLVDDVIIANAHASDDELLELSRIKPGELQLKIEFETELTSQELDVIFNHKHFVRGDVSSYMVRSTMPRITYKNVTIKPKNTRDLKRGDIVVLNDEYSRYKGELHIVLQDMENDGRKNVVGKLPANEQILLKYLTPWRYFSIIK